MHTLHPVLYPEAFLKTNKDTRIVPLDGTIRKLSSLPITLTKDPIFSTFLSAYSTMDSVLSQPDRTGKMQHGVTVSSESPDAYDASHALLVSSVPWLSLPTAHPAYIGYISDTTIPLRTLDTISITPRSSLVSEYRRWIAAPRSIRIQGTLSTATDSDVVWTDLITRYTYDSPQWKYATPLSLTLPIANPYRGYRILIDEWYTLPDTRDTSHLATYVGLDHVSFTFKEDKELVTLPTFIPPKGYVFALDTRPEALQNVLSTEYLKHLTEEITAKIQAAHIPTGAKPQVYSKHGYRMCDTSYIYRNECTQDTVIDTGETPDVFRYIVLPGDPTLVSPVALDIKLPSNPEPHMERLILSSLPQGEAVTVSCSKEHEICLSTKLSPTPLKGRRITLSGYMARVTLIYSRGVWYGLLSN